MTSPGAASSGARVVACLLAPGDLEELTQLRSAVGPGVRLAALQGEGVAPLSRVLDDLAAEGGQPVRIVCLSRDRRGARSWVSRVVAHWLRGNTLPITIDEGVAHTDDELAGALTHDVEGQCRRPHPDDPLTSPAWQCTPDFTQHVLVCRGPRCNAKGADRVAEALVGELACRDALDEPVLVASTGCLYPCNRAPVVVVNPGNQWHEQMTADRARQLAIELATAPGGGPPPVWRAGSHTPGT